MSLTAGTRLGPYDILTPLGAGGMGEVYRATDSRLKRQVALKILPTALAADPDRLARFQREAEVLASLNHPHIAAIYGLEDSDGVKALVMELVEGPTLADRIAQGPVPIDEALPIARQIAQALEGAHERGIVHRDLKPANIKVRDDGMVKVLDFGLAKLGEAADGTVSGAEDTTRAPSVTSPAAMTAMGVILGTAAYMSPEQARGRAVDKRTDIWAFGAVLYEMLAGVRAFGGDDLAEVMAGVLKSTPDWSALPADIPPHVVTLIQRCLEKDRNARIGDAAVARFLLTDAASLSGSSLLAASSVVSAPAPRPRRIWPSVATAAVLGLVVGAAVAWLPSRRPAETRLLTQLQMGVLPAEQLIGSIASVRPARTAMAISPDGRRVLFVGRRGTVNALFQRELERAEATPLAGTEGAIAPFFSSDGGWAGFVTETAIRKVRVDGGSVSTICEVPGVGNAPRRVSGATWADDGTIFFATDAGIFKVASSGGAPVTVTHPDPMKGERHVLPQALPGAKALLFTTVTARDWATANVVVQPLEGGERRVLIAGGADARLAGPRHLAYLRRGTLAVVPFDLQSQQVSGTPATVVDDIMQAVNTPNATDDTGAGQFAVSASGALLYVRGGVSQSLESSWVWLDRAGAAQPVTTVPAGPYLFPRLAPDGDRVAVLVRSGPPDVWVYSLSRGAPQRVTFEGNANWPVWSPDGTRIVYGSRSAEGSGLMTVAADGSGAPARLTTGTQPQVPASWSASSSPLVFLERPREGVSAIWSLDTANVAKPRLIVESRFALFHPELSPDGRWLAYVSNESGAFEVYVQAFPGPGGKTRISTAGGVEPIWNPNGRELLYRTSGRVMSVAIESQSPFRAAAPRLLFETAPGDYDSTMPLRSWNVSPDGRRFLLQRFAESKDKPVTEIHVVLNWVDALTRVAR